MKLGILVCDHVHNTLQTEFADYPQMFENCLLEVDPKLEIKNFLVIDGDLPAQIDVCDSYMITGSKWGVNDTQPWIEQLEIFIQELYTAGKGLVGICFGHQLIARALGGMVQRSDKGWGIGVQSNQLLQKSDWMTPFQPTLDLVVSHQDQIVELPPESRVLACNDFCRYSMIQVGNNFLGIQGHPEFSRAYSHALIKRRKDIIPPARVIEGIDSLKNQPHSFIGMKWLLNFLRQQIKP